ncbi:MAG: hypothetical protein ACFE96_13330 [Candidatus Hermodarchaeota archaeon]
MSLNKNQLRNRVIFVGDRIAFGILVSVGILIILISIFYAFENVILINPWIFLILGINTLIFFLFYIITNEEFYYVERIFANSNFIFVEITWLNATLIVALFFSLFYGWLHILEITIIYLIVYIAGYSIARIVWKKWINFKKSVKIILILIIIFSLSILSVTIGIIFLVNDNIRSMILSFILGFGILGSIGLNALMLALFLDKSGNDVLEDPPSKLVIIGIVNTLIVSLIVWILMIVFIPIPPASKKGGKSAKFSYPKGRSRYRRSFWGYRRRRYIFFGPVMEEHHKHSVSYYWDIAMKKKELRDPVVAAQVEEAKEKIIDILLEEEVVPSSKDLQRLAAVPHLIFDAALDELKDENKIIYRIRAKSDWWAKGYSITGQYYLKLENKKEIKVEEPDEKLIFAFIEEIRNKKLVKTKYELWEIGNRVGIRPRWKITPTINKLKKEGKILYSRTKPVGWSAA